VAATGGSAAATDPQAAYNAAFEKLKAGNYDAAITAFKSFMTHYPSSDLLDNAQYWIGEAYYVTRDYEHAAQAFRTVGERWPGSRKAPDALLKLGYTQFEQKHLTEARATLNLVVQKYPGGDAARLAQERLQRLPPEAR
jgi:tol-pal system protein YbgF